MNILIVGGTGVLSSAVTIAALRQGIGVTMINRGNRPIPNGVEHIKSDKNDYQRIADAIAGRKYDAVMDFLLYSDNDTKRSVEFYTQYTNQYFYISSCAVYNTETLAGKVSDEESPKVLPVWSYSVNKWASEKIVMKLFENKETHYTIIRPCVTYGDTRIPYGISPQYGYHWTLVARVLNDKPIITWNEGKNRCNMTRVEDFAVGVVGLIGNTKAYNEAFNICGDEFYSQGEVLDCISEIVNHPVNRINIDAEFYASEIPYRRGELIGGRCIDSLNSNAKLKDAVSTYKHTYTLKEGIRKTIKAYKSQNYQYGIDWKFEAETDRTIRKWCRKKGIKLDRRATSFIDYLGTATINDRIKYWFVFHDLYSIYISLTNIKNRIKKRLKLS